MKMMMMMMVMMMMMMMTATTTTTTTTTMIKRIAPPPRTVYWLSFEWSHSRISSTDSKVGKPFAQRDKRQKVKRCSTAFI